jgi:hypothetical protein
MARTPPSGVEEDCEDTGADSTQRSYPVSPPTGRLIVRRNGHSITRQIPKPVVLVDTREKTPFDFGRFKNWIADVRHCKLSVARQVGKEINRLISEGLAPHDIAVISLRVLGAKENIVYAEELGGHKAVPAAHDDAGSQIICDTFLRFKGLERPAVIVTDLRLVSDLYEKRMHIAISRALSILRIVGVEAEIRKDTILAGFIS